MLKNSLYNLLGLILRTGFTFLTVPLLIRLIGVREYGLWTLVSTVLGIVALAEGGLSVSTTVFLSQEIATDNRQGISQVLTITITGMLVLASLAGLILWANSGQILDSFPNLEVNQRLSAAITLKWGALFIWAKLWQQVMVGVEQAHKRYDWLNVLNTLQIVASTIGMVAIASGGGKIVALMQWQATTALVMLFLHGWVGFHLLVPYQPKFTWNGGKGWEIWRYSSATWVTSLGSALFQQGDRLIVGSILGTELLGAYGAITTVTTQINVFSSIAIQPLLPRLGELLQGSRDRLEYQIKQATQANFILGIGLGAFVLLLSPWLIFILFGQYNSQYQLALQLAAIAYALYSLNAVGYYILLGLGAANISMIIVTMSGIFSLLLIIIGAKLWGIAGAGLGNIGYIGTLSCMAIAMNRLHISPQKWIGWLHPQEIWLFSQSLLQKTNLFPLK
ncbi:oligosaccharide flippase family protein [Merismopedia glauca]|uniref:Polysaccharide biosynthesis protein n=1 Tax=Merismopedia glauca CCAP 1448/3 TaxID=1296344 RepID=A0A2T1C768_9CYAN|nr:oligosaccharide flippase family protein [Merismopedia glauca]PSB04099.1 polysaccharide biosynthesis protein [Merismopedia glauca CCAP 1448/3]